MERLGTRYFIITGMSIAFIITAVTGLIKFPGLVELLGLRRVSFPLGYISTIHDWSSIALIAFIIAHVILNFRWFVCATKMIFEKEEKR
ncbi:MAG TPA: DUF4405 domain-containing protein [Nanoarchaeota archaeon]|nr:DUF4405 domain-containing protein [Nanoarchaeota archaeon]